MQAAASTLNVFDRLKGSFTEEQAHRLSELFFLSGGGLSAGEPLARRDIKELEAGIRSLELKIAETQHSLKALEAKMQHDLKELEGRVQHGLKALEAKVQHDLKEQEGRIQNSLKGLEGKMQHGLKELELQISRNRTETATEIGRAKVETIKWAAGFFLAQTGLLAGVLATFVKVMTG